VTNGTTDAAATKPTGSNRKVIHATCAVHHGPAGFANVVVSKRDGTIELDPHVTGACVLTLGEDEATALRDVLTEWLG
jgi:nitrate/TMAO reductase-like tetraheme cytochrome c subunit